MNISTNDKDVIALMTKAMPSAIAGAAVFALNRAIDSGRSVMVKSVASDLNLKQRDVRAAVPVKHASASSPMALFSGALKKIPLVRWVNPSTAKRLSPSRKRGRGVPYKLPRGRGRVAESFMATMASGHTGVFVRIPDKLMSNPGQVPGSRPWKNTWKRKQQILELHGPSIGHVFGGYDKETQSHMSVVFMKDFKSDLDRRTNKTGNTNA